MSTGRDRSRWIGGSAQLLGTAPAWVARVVVMARVAAVSSCSYRSDKVGSGSFLLRRRLHRFLLGYPLDYHCHCSTGDHVGDKWSVSLDSLELPEEVENETWVRKCSPWFFFVGR